SPDGISVPRPVGTVPAFQMWLQRKVAGRVATSLLAAASDEALSANVELVRRIAAAAHKIHQARIPTRRRHTMADELRILRECRPAVGIRLPHLERRLANLLKASDRLGAATPEPSPCGIHRDFYADQVLVAALDGSPDEEGEGSEAGSLAASLHGRL